MAITAEARTDIIALVVGMFDAAPGATFLSQFVNAVDAGSTIDTLAADLAGTAAFKGTYPDLQTNNEFATKFVDNLVGTEASDASKAWAVTWIEAQLNGGATKAEVIVSSINALRAIDETDANWGNAAGALNNKVTVAEWYSVDQLGNATDLATLQNQVATVTSDDTTVTDITSGSAQSGDTFTLTTGVDTVSGTAANDAIEALIDDTTGAVASTLSALDSVDGGAGTDTLTLNILNGAGAAGTAVTALPAVTVTNVETANVRSAVALTADVSAWTGLTDVNVTQVTGALDLTAAATTAVSTSGVTGNTTVDGGSTQTITATAGDVDSDNAAGAVTVSHTATAGQAIAVDDGTAVTVNASGITTGGSIVVGATDAASGAVVVNATGAAYAAADTDHAMGTVAVTGGTTATVAQTASSDTALAATDTVTVATVTQGAVTVTGDNSTTAVTVTQEDQVTAVDAVTAVTGVNETQVITFVAMAAGETTVVDGLTFTAAKALTAAEAAAAFADLTASATHGSASSNGIYTGNTTANWTSGSVSGATVTFTEVTAGAGPGLVVSDTAAAGNVAAAAGVTGVTAVAGVTGVMGVANGAVTIADGGTDSITTVTVDGYAASTIAADALTTLSLANSGAGTMAVTTAATSLNLTVNDVDAAVTVDAGAATITDLTVTTATEDSAFALTAAAVTALTVSGTNALDLTGSTLSALETVTVSGAGNVTLGDISATAETLNASAATGAISATVAGDTATVTTGTGNDAITVDTAAISKAINLGEGDDTLTLSAATASVPTAAVDGGAGNDTVAMTFASAQALDGNTNFQTAISGFERLTISDQAVMTTADITVDMEALGFDYVTLAAGTDDTEATNPNKLILDNLANNGTVVLNAAQSATAAQASTQVNIKDAATGDADTLNLVVSAEATVAAGTVIANNVETVNITATDVYLDNNGVDTNNAVHTLTLDADKVTSVVVTGDDLTLDTNSTVLTAVDASAMTGGITYTADGAAAGTTVTGGAGADNLTADGSGDTLLGGAGNDTLTGANLTTLTGGEGTDTFVVNIPTNVNSYSTITDLAAGDTIQLTATESFVSTAITLADTAVFQDYANAAVNQLATDDEDAAWFQFGGNTYVVINDDQGDAIDADFENGADAIIQITGTVDLSTASYNETAGTLVVA
jgi:S-layer protein